MGEGYRLERKRYRDKTDNKTRPVPNCLSLTKHRSTQLDPKTYIRNVRGDGGNQRSSSFRSSCRVSDVIGNDVTIMENGRAVNSVLTVVRLKCSVITAWLYDCRRVRVSMQSMSAWGGMCASVCVSMFGQALECVCLELCVKHKM